VRRALGLAHPTILKNQRKEIINDNI
jgi:hypothetical protein